MQRTNVTRYIIGVSILVGHNSLFAMEACDLFRSKPNFSYLNLRREADVKSYWFWIDFQVADIQLRIASHKHILQLVF